MSIANITLSKYFIFFDLMTKILIALVLVGLASAIFFKEHPMSVNSASDAGYE